MINRAIILILILLLLTLILILVTLQPQFTGKTITNQEDYRTFTKAVCNSSNYCQDYLYTCNNKQTISIQPITGAAIQLPEDYKQAQISNLSCDN